MRKQIIKLVMVMLIMGASLYIENVVFRKTDMDVVILPVAEVDIELNDSLREQDIKNIEVPLAFFKELELEEKVLDWTQETIMKANRKISRGEILLTAFFNKESQSYNTEPTHYNNHLVTLSFDRQEGNIHLLEKFQYVDLLFIPDSNVEEEIVRLENIKVYNVYNEYMQVFDKQTDVQQSNKIFVCFEVEKQVDALIYYYDAIGRIKISIKSKKMADGM